MTTPSSRTERAFGGGVVSRETEPIVAGRHVIEDISYRDERITCTCDAVITAARDSDPDRHAPLVRAWEQHKLEARREGSRRGRAT